MDEIVVETDVAVPPDEAFSFLRDFPGYVKYSDYLDDVVQHGDGGVGTRYDLSLSWWRLSYTAKTEVTGIDAPNRIEWRVLRAVNANGTWEIEPVEPPDAPWEGSRVRLRIRYDPDSADPGVLKLPRFVSMSWIVNRVKPLIVPEAQATVERIVADLEGERRPVDLDITTRKA